MSIENDTLSDKKSSKPAKRICSWLMLVAGIWSAEASLAIGPCTVPLKLININAGSGKPAEYKLGIFVRLGGGAPQLYEFDTGGPGFWAAYTSSPPQKKGQWWAILST